MVIHRMQQQRREQPAKTVAAGFLHIHVDAKMAFSFFSEIAQHPAR
jgi:hypothetical protein